MTEKKTDVLEGSLFPQTTSTYRCTNEVCQDEKEKQVEKRLGLIKAKQIADELRAQQKSDERDELRKITADEMA